MNRYVLLLISACCSLPVERPVFADASRPNIVLIIADDQSWSDFGFMGNQRVHTPNLDRLASQSARFVNGYVPSSVCRPSLVSILTGLYPHQHGVHFNHGPPGNAGYNRMTSAADYRSVRQREFDLIRRVKTLPRLLQQHGYRCLQTGKFWEGHWRNAGFTEGMTLFEPPPITQEFGGARTLASGDRVAHGNGDIGLQIGRETMKPIEDFIYACEHDGAKTPWMVWYAPYLPHQPHDSSQRFRDLAAKRENVSSHELPYFASIAQFDETVGQLVRYVEANANNKNTVFVFVSDNGWRPSEKEQRSISYPRPQFAHTTRSKRAPFDEGLRTPILIRWDGVVKSQQHDGLVTTVDLMPTLLSAASFANKSYASLPGKDLMPMARGEAELPPDRAVFGAVYPGDATSLGHPERDVAYRWIRQRELKLIIPESKPGSRPWGNYLDSPALFDVAADPFEQINLIRERAADARILTKQLDAWWTLAPASSARKPE